MNIKMLSNNSISQTPTQFKPSTLISGQWRLADWRLNAEERLSFIQSCVEQQITTFDHADIYGNYLCESLFGEALKLSPSVRQEIQIISKCGIKLVSENRPKHQLKSYDTRYQHIVHSVESSLKALNTDYLDCILIHRPDPLMDASEIARAFSDLKRDGKIISAGVSNFEPHQIELLNAFMDFPLVTNQIEVSVTHIDAFFNGQLDFCQQKQMIPMAWSPLGGGQLFQNDQNSPLLTKLKEIAEFHESSIDVIALAWLLYHPAKITPILGTGNIERLKNAVKAKQISLSHEEWFAILEASRGKRVP